MLSEKYGSTYTFDALPQGYDSGDHDGFYVTVMNYAENPTGPLTVTSSGSGTPSDPFKVYNVATLQKVGKGTDGWTLDASYEQVTDIDLSNVTWTPIGDNIVGSEFIGSYDGNGKTISNLKIDSQSSNYQGLFGYFEDAIVKNVGLVNCDVKGRDYIGGVVGYNGGTVLNCAALNPNISGSSDVGRVAGINSSATLTNNYGRSDMKKGGNLATWTNIGANALDGANITLTQWGSSSWRTGTAKFDSAAWDISNGRLPKLRNMPGEAQNPAVK